MMRSWASDEAAVIAAVNSATFMSRMGESSSRRNTTSWSFPRAKSIESVEAVCLRRSMISSLAIFSG